jgi:Asp-tRNA(Asn)/Glu-tRNA(Gln) amidotransferase A subunit family amidase
VKTVIFSKKVKMDFKVLSAKEAIGKIKEGTLDPYDWNAYFINNVKAKDAIVQAWAYFDENLWQNQLKAVLNDPDQRFSELLAVPVGVKDIFNTKDMPTSMGSPIWKGFTPGNDARVVHNIKFNKGIIAGKTVTAEFAVHAPNETRNPWNTEYSPGTSSSGSAAAVAARMVPMALATQTAGSVIRPASYCGIFGFKPTFGSIPRTAMLKTTDTLDTVGLFATNTDDCRLLFDTIRVHGMDYPIVHEKLNDPKLQSKNGRKWKVGFVVDQHWTHENVSTYASRSFEEFRNKLSNGNVEIGFPQFNELFQRAHEVQETIYHKALSYYFKKEFENHTLISPVMYEIVEEGKKIDFAHYKNALEAQETLQHDIDKLFDEYDVLITLSTAGIAPKFGTAIDPPDTCLIWTMCGLPVLNVPIFSHEGMPHGLQIIARKYTDYKLLNFVKEFTGEFFPEFSEVAL